jgi:hypothetical protein
MWKAGDSLSVIAKTAESPGGSILAILPPMGGRLVFEPVA